MNNTIKTRVQNKHDLEANWLKALTFVPYQGEIIIYDIEVDADGNTLTLPEGRTEPYTHERLKIGDGIHIVKDLPFADEAALEAGVVALAEAQKYTDTALDGYARIGTESDDDRELTIYGAREFATRATETVVGGANDTENDNTVYGAKAYAAKIVEDTENALIGQETDAGSADTISGAKNFAVEYTNQAVANLDSYVKSADLSDLVKVIKVDNASLADEAKADQMGNEIITTYATKTEVANQDVAVLAEAQKYTDEKTNFNTVVTSGTGANTVQQVGTGAQAIGDNSTALGSSIAGCMGYYYEAIDLTNKKIYLCPERVVEPILGAGATYDTINPEYAPGDKIAIVNNNKFFPEAYIESIEGSVITYSGDMEFTQINPDATDTDLDQYCVYVIAKPILSIESGARVIKDYAHAEGRENQAQGAGSHAEGRNNLAYGDGAHAEGRRTKAAWASHSEGQDTEAGAFSSHTEGRQTITVYNTAECSHAEGRAVKVSGYAAHGEGIGKLNGTAVDDYSEATGRGSHVEGVYNKALAEGAHAEGCNNTVSGVYGHVEGQGNTGTGPQSHTEGAGNTNSGYSTHVEGERNTASTNQAHAEGGDNILSGSAHYGHVEGRGVQVTGYGAHGEGIGELDANNALKNRSQATGKASHVEGIFNKVTGEGAHAEGYKNIVDTSTTTAKLGNTEVQSSHKSEIGCDYSHVEGYGNQLIGGLESHIEGKENVILGRNGKSGWGGSQCHIEGFRNVISGDETTEAHVEGRFNKATNAQAHAEGQNTIASGAQSHAGGLGTKATAQAQTAIGKYNKEDNEALFIVGNGESASKPSNAFVVRKDGSVLVNGQELSNNTSILPWDIAYNGETKSIIGWMETFAEDTTSVTEVVNFIESLVSQYKDLLINYPQAVIAKNYKVDTFAIATDYIDIQYTTTFDYTLNPYYGIHGNTIKICFTDSQDGEVTIDMEYGTGNHGAHDGTALLRVITDSRQLVATYEDWGYPNYWKGSTTISEIAPTDNKYCIAGVKKNHYSGIRNTIEGFNNQATGAISHVEGEDNTTDATHVHIEGRDNTVNSGENSSRYTHIEGRWNTVTSGLASHVEGKNNTIEGSTNPVTGEDDEGTWGGSQCHIEGLGNLVSGDTTTEAHVEGRYNKVYAEQGHAEGYETQVSAGAKAAHAEGWGTIASGKYSHAEGSKAAGIEDPNGMPIDDVIVEASGESSHAEGRGTKATGEAAHAEGCCTEAQGHESHAEGYWTNAVGASAHSEGNGTFAKGEDSHAEGHWTRATKWAAHSEGISTDADGEASHAEGCGTKAYERYSHASGLGTITEIEAQTAVGKYNAKANRKDISDLLYASTYEGASLSVDSYGFTYEYACPGSTAKDIGQQLDALPGPIYVDITYKYIGKQYDADSHSWVETEMSTSAVGQVTWVHYSYNAENDDSILTVMGTHPGLNIFNHVRELDPPYYCITGYVYEGPLFVVGNGSGDDDENRSNAFEVHKDGNGVFAGNVSANGKKLATEEYVDNAINNQNTETWTFTLEDGSTITKAVRIG